jgi:hypothetical protein
MDALLVFREADRCTFRALERKATAVTLRVLGVDAGPHFTTIAAYARRQSHGLCWNAGQLIVHLTPQGIDATVARGTAAWVSIDSTGLSLRGPGSYRATKYPRDGEVLRHVYAGLHTLMDVVTRAPLGFVLAPATVSDHEVFLSLVPVVARVLQARGVTMRVVAGDGAYDKAAVYARCEALGIERTLVRPRVRARLWPETQRGAHLRNANLRIGVRRRIFQYGGREWRLASGAGLRSHSESLHSAMVAGMGDRLTCRSPPGQMTEVIARMHVLTSWMVETPCPVHPSAPSMIAAITNTLIIPPRVPLRPRKPYLPPRHPVPRVSSASPVPFRQPRRQA